MVIFGALWLLFILGAVVERLLTGESQVQTWVLYGLLLTMPTLLGLLQRKPAALLLIAISIFADIGLAFQAWIAGRGLLSSGVILVLVTATIPGLTGLVALAIRAPEERAEAQVAGFGRKQ